MQLSGAHSEEITLKKGQDGLKNTHVLASIIRLVGENASVGMGG